MSLSFYKNSEDFLTKLSDEIEKLDQDSLFDVEYSDGILNIIIEETEQEYVINRHNANKKIWYSSPISGADYFSYDENQKQWLNDNKQELRDKLLQELNQFLS